MNCVNRAPKNYAAQVTAGGVTTHAQLPFGRSLGQRQLHFHGKTALTPPSVAAKTESLKRYPPPSSDIACERSHLGTVIILHRRSPPPFPALSQPGAPPWSRCHTGQESSLVAGRRPFTLALPATSTTDRVATMRRCFCGSLPCQAADKRKTRRVLG